MHSTALLTLFVASVVVAAPTPTDKRGGAFIAAEDALKAGKDILGTINSGIQYATPRAFSDAEKRDPSKGTDILSAINSVFGIGNNAPKVFSTPRSISDAEKRAVADLIARDPSKGTDILSAINSVFGIGNNAPKVFSTPRAISDAEKRAVADLIARDPSKGTDILSAINSVFGIGNNAPKVFSTPRAISDAEKRQFGEVAAGLAAAAGLAGVHEAIKAGATPRALPIAQLVADGQIGPIEPLST